MPVEMINTGDEINFGAVAATGNLSQMTVMAWVYMDAVGAIEDADWNAYAVTQYEDGQAAGKGWGIGNSDSDDWGNTLSLFWYRDFTNAPGAWWADNTLTEGIWQHIAVTHDASSALNDPVLYVDGVSKSVTEKFTPNGTVQDVSAEDLRIGTIVANARLTFNGKITDVRIYNRILDATEIAQIVAKKAYIRQWSEYGLIFNAQCLGAAGVQSFDGAALGVTDYIVDYINGIQGTPNGEPLGWDDIYLAY